MSVKCQLPSIVPQASELEDTTIKVDMRLQFALLTVVEWHVELKVVLRLLSPPPPHQIPAHDTEAAAGAHRHTNHSADHDDDLCQCDLTTTLLKLHLERMNVGLRMNNEMSVNKNFKALHNRPRFTRMRISMKRQTQALPCNRIVCRRRTCGS